MSIVEPQPLAPMDEDPDDFRPDSRWNLVTDPGGKEGRVDDLSLIIEEVAPGDQIPLHRHRVSEMVLVLSGEAEVALAGKVHRPTAGSTVFIPAGVWHRHRNVGHGVLRIAAVFPTTVVDMDMAERNPAPGTESDAPAHTVYDLRSGTFWPADGAPPSS